MEITEDHMMRLLELEDVVNKFIHEHHIVHAESIYQMDSVSLNSLQFIEEVCDCIGYYDVEDNETLE